mgnify:CR=1 FL=1
MQFRRLGMVLVALIVVTASLAGCMAGGVADWPDREITTDLDTALAAQDMAMAGAMLGSATLSEAEFSSLLTYLMKQNVGSAVPVEEVKTWFEPDNKVYIELVPSAGAPLAGTVRLSGVLSVVDNAVQVDLGEAAIGDVAVSGALLDVVGAAINRALNDPSLGVAVDVATDSGSVTLGLAM